MEITLLKELNIEMKKSVLDVSKLIDLGQINQKLSEI